MSKAPRHRILVVDDEQAVRVMMSLLLPAGKYEVTTAENGFDGLLKIKSEVPDLIISDLNMPQMSGFEFLSVVRRRFPQILLIAMSGAYHAGDAVPGGVIADAFYAKGADSPGILLQLVSDLLRVSASRAVAQTRNSAPVWIPRNGNDAKGIPYVVLTCTECLRSFPLNIPSDVTATVTQVPCIFCLNVVRYIIDFSPSATTPGKKPEALASVAGKTR